MTHEWVKKERERKHNRLNVRCWFVCWALYPSFVPRRTYFSYGQFNSLRLKVEINTTGGYWWKKLIFLSMDFLCAVKMQSRKCRAVISELLGLFKIRKMRNQEWIIDDFNITKHNKLFIFCSLGHYMPDINFTWQLSLAFFSTRR